MWLDYVNFSYIFLSVVFLAQGVWDVAIIFDNINVQNLTSVAIKYIASNSVTIILRVALFLSEYKHIDIVLIVMAVSTLIIDFIGMSESDTVTDSMVVMIVYHSLGFISGCFSLVVNSCKKKVSVNVVVDREGVKIGKKIVRAQTEFKDSSVTLPLTESSVETVHKLVRKLIRKKERAAKQPKNRKVKREVMDFRLNI